MDIVLTPIGLIFAESFLQPPHRHTGLQGLYSHVRPEARQQSACVTLGGLSWVLFELGKCPTGAVGHDAKCSTAVLVLK